MPFAYRIDPVQGLIEATYSGALTTDEMRVASDQIIHDPAFKPEFRSLVIYSGILLTPSLTDLIKHKTWRQQVPRVRQMAIVAETELEYGVARMYELATNGVAAKEMRIFRNVKDARDWLGIPVRL